jgi:hypothetical protein
MSLKNSKLPENANLKYQAPTAPVTPDVRLPSLHAEAGIAEGAAELLERHPHPALRPPCIETDAIAILVFHGMGEQVRYETLGGLAKSLLREAAPGTIDTTVQISRPVDTFIARAQIRWTDETVDREVHLYEAYWAPLTEGQITYVETLRFLFDAARKGIKSSRIGKASSFERWMFSKVIELPIAAGTRLALLVVLSVLFLVVLLIFSAALLYANVVRGIGFSRHQILATLLPTLPLFAHAGIRLWAYVFTFVTSVLFWALIYGLLTLRTLIIQYVGDVAAYISPYKASKFQSIRNAIQKVGFDAASLIYGFTSAEIPRYRKILFVGHSLGSVIAYDTLNAVINLDQTVPQGQTQDVLGRTHALITFGSPLDKTAFLFRNQPNALDDPLREQMAAASQPLITGYDNRAPHFKWTNIWSPQDIISGSLDYYDDPTDPAYPTKKIDNQQDPHANKFIVAHTQYWNNDLLTSVLLNEIRRPGHRSLAKAADPPIPIALPK